jgi:hypothetical protein
MDSDISTSISVVDNDNMPSSAFSNTFDKIGIVLRRSTTDCTWFKALRRAALSNENFINLYPLLEMDKSSKFKPKHHAVFIGFT